MKKILFLLVLIYNYSFADYCAIQKLSLVAYSNSYLCAGLPTIIHKNYTGLPYEYCYDIITAGVGCGSEDETNQLQQAYLDGLNESTTDSVCLMVNGALVCNKNPDPLGGKNCRDLFQKDGTAYTCNPNTNEATPIPYSDGLMIDPETGDDVPKCNDGYSYTNNIHMTASGGTSSETGYKSHTCSKNATNPDGSFTGDNGVVIGADGSITTPNPAGGSTTVFVDGSTSTTHPDGSITTTPPTTPPPTTDTGTGTSGGSTGGSDSGSGSSSGGTSGTGSTGGTTGTDTGSGSTGGTDTGTTDTGGMGTDGTGGTTGGGTATGGGGGGTTGGTDSGTTTDGTTGTDTGSGSTGGTDSGTGTTEPTTGAGDCNDSTMTLTEKTLCKISNIFTPAGTTPTSNSLEGSSSLIDGVTSEYSTFKTNIETQGDTLKSLVYTSIDTVNQGFSFNISSNDVVSCPKDYTLDLSALNMANMNVVLDICLQTSKLKPYFYPLFLIMFSVGTTLITFRMLGVLI